MLYLRGSIIKATEFRFSEVLVIEKFRHGDLWLDLHRCKILGDFKKQSITNLRFLACSFRTKNSNCVHLVQDHFEVIVAHHKYHGPSMIVLISIKMCLTMQ